MSGIPDALSIRADGVSARPDAGHVVPGPCTWPPDCSGRSVMNEHEVEGARLDRGRRERCSRRFDRDAVLRIFAASIEHAALDPSAEDRIWIDELLDTMESAGWGWRDLDLELLAAVLFDGFGWTIESPPDDPARVARVLEAFLRFAGREYGAPHADSCCDYLRSPAAVDDIARWVRPFDELSPDALFAELSAPYNWCDGRCERCPLAARCPVRRFELEELRAADTRGGEPGPIGASQGLDAAVELVDDPGGPPHPLEPESPEAARLRHACREYTAAVFALRDALARTEPDRDVDELGADAMLVAGKGGRVAGYLSAAGELTGQAALMDGVPNLLLVERVMAEVDESVADRSHMPDVGSAYRVARDQLRQVLMPHLRAVPERHREELGLRVASGSAPSPFSRSA